MSKEELEQFRAILKGQLAELLGHGEETVAEMLDEKALFADPADRALFESNRNFTLRIRDRERKLITKVKEALERIDEGTFGICESCEEEIPFKRLEARPVTTLCVECKTKAEDEEKKLKS
ncbi:MAG: RNA polymerase-binding protein DksA [Proteobacteria bacterium]|nr:RNA polymerase-binding protein DksA [Pseudomonadota bacterium]